jgi:hypothetical protein
MAVSHSAATPQRALTVGEHRAVTLVAAHPAVCPDLPGRLGIVPGEVGGHADRLTNRGHP